MISWRQTSALVFGIALVGLMPMAATAQTTIYSSIPAALPGNVVSEAFEATSTVEFGDQVQFAANTPRRVKSATVLMSSWGCESGGWVGGCTTTAGATFSHPITLNVYAVDNSGPVPAAGALLLTKTATFAIPFRPSSDSVNCSANPTKWFSTQDGICYNGYATPITFNLETSNVILPADVIWSVAYNTTHYGAAPIGQSAPCFSTSAGCGYDSLNVGAETFPGGVGVDTDPDGAFANSSWAGAYCDNGASGTGTFRLDTGCWAGYRPLAEIKAFALAATANQCKANGWSTLTRANGTTFKNQGDCIQYVNTGK